jgi:crotonobetainyl-CoA:carnitine CoA-transferase CaiB-like acyl-CoA transferase
VLDGFRPGVMDRLGLGYRTLAQHKASIVHCSITGYGQHGPRRDAAGHDINYLALSGVLDMTGRAGEPPALPGFLLCDILGGTLCAAMGILAALLDARSTGRGRFIDVSMADAVMAHCVLPLAEYQDSGAVHARGTGSHTGGAPRYNVYATRDGRYLAVGAQEKKFWDVLCDALQMPDLKRHHQPDAAQAREVEARLRAAFARRDAQAWLALLEPLDCCVTPVLTFEEALAQPGFRERGTVRPGNAQPALVLGLPFVMSDLVSAAYRPAPAPGADTVRILEQLGYAAGRIGALRARGVI